MKNIIAVSTGAFILVIAFSCCLSDLYAQTSRSLKPAETARRASETLTKSTRPRARTDFVRMANFYLRDGKLVFGKLLSEEKNKITVERLDESRIVVSTYSKREVDSRTLQVRSIAEAAYYIELAEYFSGRTWDFRDDPDDFIQAIRCYEKAKRSLAETQGPDSEKIDEINKKIEHLQADRQIWTREVESRAKLKKLEFEATIETRLKELEDKVNASSQQIDKIATDVKDNYQKLEKSIAGIEQGISRHLNILEERIEANRRLIDPWGPPYPRYRYPRRYYRPGDIP